MDNDDWRNRASCRKTDKKHFYAHEEGDRLPIPEFVIALCLQCPVNQQCLDYALKYEGYGYWAGTTAKERREIRQAKGIVINRSDSKLRFSSD